MKKLLVLLAVLAMANVANAKLTFTVDGVEAPANATIANGATQVIGVNAAGEQALLAMLIAFEGSGAAVDSSAMTMIDMGFTGAPDSNFIIDVSTEQLYVDWIKGFGFDPFALFFWEIINVDIPQADIPDGEIIGAISLSSSAKWGTITISMFDDTTEATVATQTIKQIPEPATLALLAAGALLLRRRK